MSKKSSYYAGGMRFVRNGIPCKVASWVADLTPMSRDAFMRGSDYQFEGLRGKPQEARNEHAKARHPQTTYYTVQETIDRANAERERAYRSFSIAAE